jgi:hypothetical protein
LGVLNRRKFLKYAGATATVVGASALGLGYLVEPQTTSVGTTATTTTASKFNHPPVAQFDYTPKRLNPTEQQTVQFTNLSMDLDNDALKYAWFVDDQLVSENKDYSARLPVGEHLIRLNVSDSQAGDVTEKMVTVEPDQIYPTKKLNVKYKGVNYFAGRPVPTWWNDPTPKTEEVDEQLDTIRDELGCNSILILAGSDTESNLIEAGKLAIEKEFERIYLSPYYCDATIDETAEKIAEFSEQVKSLREVSASIVFMFGHELSFAMKGITPGDTWDERIAYPAKHNNWTKLVSTKLPGVLKRIIQVCKENYGYQVAYAASWPELDSIPWSDPIFESVCMDAYIVESTFQTKDWIANRLSGLKRFGKPVIASEFGCETFTGAGSVENGWLIQNQRSYDEDEQANYIKRYCDMLNNIRIDGAFWWAYNEEDVKGYGLYNGLNRRKGFYMYKSYQRTL